MFIPYSYDDSEIMLHHSLNNTPQDTDFPMHAHHNCELYLFISGNGYFAVEGNIYSLENNTMLLMRAGETHKLHIQPNAPYERVAIHFPTDLLTDVALSSLYHRCMDRPLGQYNQLTVSAAQTQWIQQCLSRIYEIKDTDAGHSDTIRTYLRAILLELEAAAKQNASPLSMPTNHADEPAIVSQIVSYINEHLLEIHGLTELEDRFYFSASYLNRIFKKTIGSSIWDYVILKRLMYARNLLGEGKNVTTAYMMAGFSDYSSFFKQYKNRFGATPIQDRKRKDVAGK